MACRRPSERARQKGKMIFMILLTTGMFITEIVVGYRTGSLALVNDSFNMISAIISLVIGFICLWLSTKETKKNTYGWARVEIWAALVNSVFMLALCFSIFTSAIQRLISPEKVQEADLVLIVGGVGFVVNLIGIGVFLNETMGDLKKNKEKVEEESRNENCPRHGTDNAGLANPAFVVDNDNVNITNNNNNVEIVNNYNNNHNSNNNDDDDDDDINNHNVDIVNNYNSKNSNNSNNNNNNNNNIPQIVIEPKLTPAVKTRKLSVTEADLPQNWHHVRFGKIDTISEAVTRNGEISIDLETEVFPETNSPYPRRRSANADSICLDIPDDEGCDSPDDDEEGMTNMVATVSHIYAGPPVEDDEEIPRKNQKKKKNKKIKSGNQMNIQGVFLHLLGDALGSVSVIVSGLINHYCQGDWVDRMDPAISLIVVIIIFISTIPLLRQTSNILLQRVPKNVNVPVLLEELKKEVRDIANIHDLHVWQLVGTRIIASLHIRCSDLTQYIRASKQIKAFFHNNGIHSTTIQPEFLEHQETPNERECYLECGPELKCHEDTCCCVNKKSKKKKISTTSTASGISFQSALSTDTAISLESDLGGTTLI